MTQLLFMSVSLCRSFSTAALKRTALYNLHRQHGAKMVPFAGWSMPLQYQDLGIVASCLHTRTHTSLFDVSHMLQTRISGLGRIRFLESLCVADLTSLPTHHAVLSMFMNANGGIVDDTILTKWNDAIYVVSNAGCADKDIAYLRHHATNFPDVHVDFMQDTALLAIQGPDASKTLANIVDDDRAISDPTFGFMSTRFVKVDGVNVHVSRSGYTGEDGFEVQVPASFATKFAEMLLAQPNVKWSGLGARDSLRLEAGMCLYGHDIDDATSPVEAGLTWTIGKRRRSEGGFLGSSVVLDQLKNGVSRRRVGFIVQGAPAREGALIFDESGKQELGKVTSGGPSPNCKQNIAMGYIKTGFHKAGTLVSIQVRGKLQKATVSKMPFFPSRYTRVPDPLLFHIM